MRRFCSLMRSCSSSKRRSRSAGMSQTLPAGNDFIDGAVAEASDGPRSGGTHVLNVPPRPRPRPWPRPPPRVLVLIPLPRTPLLLTPPRPEPGTPNPRPRVLPNAIPEPSPKPPLRPVYLPRPYPPVYPPRPGWKGAEPGSSDDVEGAVPSPSYVPCTAASPGVHAEGVPLCHT